MNNDAALLATAMGSMSDEEFVATYQADKSDVQMQINRVEELSDILDENPFYPGATRELSQLTSYLKAVAKMGRRQTDEF